MLGLRGIRLGLMIPDLIKMQTRAILNAAIRRVKDGGHPHAEIMIPLVGHVNELADDAQDPRRGGQQGPGGGRHRRSTSCSAR